MSAGARLGSLAALLLAAGCYTGGARDASPERIAADPDWQVVGGVPFVAQRGDVDCGAAALAMVLAHHGVLASAEAVSLEAPPRDGGIAAGQLRDVARRRGLQAFVVSGSWDDLQQELGSGRPVVVGLLKPVLAGRARAHFEVVVGFNRKHHRILTLDPARGLREISAEGFAREWGPARQLTLIVLPPAPGSRRALDPPRKFET